MDGVTMSYRIQHQEPVTEATSRIADEQIEQALADLVFPSDGSSGSHHDEIVEAVHDFRKRCRKVRGLIRLVRPPLGEKEYEKANTMLRDAARQLSPFRDDHALLATFDNLVAAHPDRVPTGGLTAVRDHLRERAHASTETLVSDTGPVERADELLRTTQERIHGWSFDDASDALVDGVATTYGRGHYALDVAIDAPKPKHYHELRKRSKYTWYHLRLVRDSAPSILRPLAKRFHDLSNGLGDAHDLVVLRRRLTNDAADGGLEIEPDELAGAVAMLDDVREILDQRSVSVARRLYAEKPKQFTKRLGSYWNVWNEDGDEPDVGEITDLWRPDGQFDDDTVADLRERASSLDIPHRSGMRREELVAALRAAGHR